MTILDRNHLIVFHPSKIGHVPNKLAFKLTQKTQHHLEYRLAEYLVRDLKPFSTVEGEGFKAFSEAMNPKFHIPSRRTIQRRCDDLSDVSFSEVSKILNDHPHFPDP